ncbi:MAG: cation-translocating P-type ATPase [Gammaproteobacteria bacterium]|nr:heavy metal translocating P-type ATPase [Gammaproteobacteria bacterium]
MGTCCARKAGNEHAAPGSCWHCGGPLPAEDRLIATVAGERRAVCGETCRAAAERIDALGLASYYDMRAAPGPKPEAEGAAEAAVWQRPEIARHVIRDLGDGRRETLLVVDGVRCAACVMVVERALFAEPGVEDVEINGASKRARVVWREAETSLPRLLDALARIGYRALPLDAEALDDVRRHESRSALKRLVVAGFGAMQAMMYAGVLYLGDPASLDVAARDLFRWLGFLVATPVVLYSAQPFFAGAMRCLKTRRLGMDVPVALAVAAIYVASLIEAMRGGVHVYFEGVSMFVFFLLIGRYVEMRARHRASDLTDALARLTPPYADRRLANGDLERVGVRELMPGDRVHVAEGGVIPADGVLLSERCRVDEALLTGESAPVERRRGETLVAGSVLVDGPVDLRVERVGTETALAGIAELVARAQAAKPKLALEGEKTASRFVLRVLLLTAATAAAWAWFDPSRAFAAALAVLVVSCPCAFALAVPVAVTRALAVLARRGVLVVKPDAIEGLAGATHVVFDKTGTLTEPDLEVVRVDARDSMSSADALRLAAALARESRHPVARAIAAACPNAPLPAATNVEMHAGLGVRATVGGRELRLGRADFALEGNAATSMDEDAVLLADDTGPIAAFHLSERLRPDARIAVRALERQGVHVTIASGDSAQKVRAVAERLGIDDWHARQAPSDKLARLAALREQGARVIAVGDGVNDAPVLGGADVAVAIAEGAELAQATSDIVLSGGKLEHLAPAREIAAETLAILEQNQRWAFAYNMAAVPLAALGFVPPLLAALGMSVSSLVVVLNAMRIGRGIERRERQADRAAPIGTDRNGATTLEVPAA